MPNESSITNTKCLHCGNPMPETGEVRDARGLFCCTGCQVVYGLLHDNDLERYYALRGDKGVPVREVREERRDVKWLEPFEDRLRSATDLATFDLDVQGIHCTACVWLFETIFSRQGGGVTVQVNPARGCVRVTATPKFDLGKYVKTIESFGYLFGPPHGKRPASPRGLIVRMGVCIALAMNAMLLAFSMYGGLSEGPLYVTFMRLNLLLSAASVAVGGPVFFASAWRGLRHGVLHLDLPIALGILLAFGGSLWSYAHQRAGGIYIDTIDVFIALMLVGRFLQERILDRNRLSLLENDGVAGLLTRKVGELGVVTVPCTELRAGDSLFIGPGEVVPIDAKLLSESALFSLDWINGESRPREFVRNDTVPAGSFLAGHRAETLIAEGDFATSNLVELLRNPEASPKDAAMSTAWWRLFSQWYAALVLLAAAAGFLGWYLRTHDVARSVEIATAVLVVTCPCAFGIATPIAYDLVQAGLRRAGLYVRTAGFLDRAARVKRVVFDKTGTLTDGQLALVSNEPLLALSPRDRETLYKLASWSSHPKSAAVARAIAAISPPAQKSTEGPSDAISEVPSRGVVAQVNGAEYRLGDPAWAGASVGSGDVAFSVNGSLLAAVRTRESLRADARSEVAALESMGYEVWLLSGDNSARAAQTAQDSGVPPRNCVGGATPENKAAWVREHDHEDTLMIGDGINDALAISEAYCGGTPATDRPFVASRSDFYFVTPGLKCIRTGLIAAKGLTRVRNRNLALAVAYNVLSVGLAYAGVLSPLVCAILMPTSSIITIATTIVSLGPRSALWKS